jgi:L-amino acid N-acyltransferase YncA
MWQYDSPGKKEPFSIKNMTADDWPEVAEIYMAGIATKNATFEQQAPDWQTWSSSHRSDCRLIASLGSRIVGWAALSNVSNRCVYGGVAEVSIYVDPEFQGRGIGDRLMKALITESEYNGIWTLQAGIFPENEKSIQLHLRNGFRIIGTRERIGKMDGVWRDTVLMERRSDQVGVD